MNLRAEIRQWLHNAAAAYVEACITAGNKAIPRGLSIYRDVLRDAHMHKMFYGGPRDCIDYLRMSPNTFFHLAQILRERSRLKDTPNVSIEKQLAIFLHIVGHSIKHRVIKIDSIQSGEIINRLLNTVLGAIGNIRDMFMHQPTPCDPIPEEITSSTMYYPWFKDCVGLIDCTHIKIRVPFGLKGSFTSRKTGRKEGTTHNVLAAATPNKLFTNVIAGWDGCATDFTVLKDALSRKEPEGLRLIPGKYYLCDAAYPTMPGFIAPYKSVQCHVSEHGQMPKNRQELFNLRHSSLRSNIESAFGILKNRFQILREHSFFPMDIQIHIVLACFILHNYIMQMDPNDYYANLDVDYDNGPNEVYSEVNSYHEQRFHREQGDKNRLWVEKKDNLARDMWTSYCETNRGGDISES